MVYMVLILNIFLGVTQNFLGKEFSRKYGADKRALLGFNIIVMGIATISAFLLMMKSYAGFEWYALLFGIFAGLGYVLGFYYNFLAYENGVGLATASMIVQSSMIAPIVVGWFIVREEMYVVQVIGILLLLLSMYLIFTGDNGKRKIGSKKGLMYVLLTFLANAVIAVCQKLYPYCFPKAQSTVFTFFTFLCSCFISSAFYFMNKGKRIKEYDRYFFTNSGGTGIILCVRNLLGIFLAANMVAAIQYPITSSMILVLTTILSALVYRENMSKKKIVGIAICIMGTVCLGI